MPSWFPSGSGGKLLVMAAAVAVLWFLARWVAARSESSAHDPSMMSPSARPVTRLLSEEEVDDPSAAPAASGRVAEVHPQMDLGPVLLRKLYFHNMDALEGPADAADFVDELTVEVLFKSTGAVVENTYTVATPVGLGRLMQAKQWGVFYSPEMFVVPAYDLESIRQAVLDHLLDNSDAPDLPNSNGPERLAL